MPWTWFGVRPGGRRRLLIHVDACDDRRKSEKVPIIECIEHVQVYPVQLTWVRRYATLSGNARDWIEHGGLQMRYPRVHLYYPDWEWLPSILRWTVNESTYIWEWMLDDILFRGLAQ